MSFGRVVESGTASIANQDYNQSFYSTTSTAIPPAEAVEEIGLHDSIDNSRPVNPNFPGPITQTAIQLDQVADGGKLTTRVIPTVDSFQNTAILGKSPRDEPTTTHLFVQVHRERHVGCDPRCPCICHREKKGRTPDAFTSLIGKLFIGYSGTPIGSIPCSIRSCRNSVAFRAKATYIFPAWFIGKSISLLLWKTQKAELSMLLKVRNYSQDEKIFQHLGVKDWTKVELLIRHDRVSPNDLESAYGQTLMHVSLFHLSSLMGSFKLHTNYSPPAVESA